MELDSRKVLILKAVIKNYLETGEPVGSRTISKLPECSFSSATIRNEMCDLEDVISRISDICSSRIHPQEGRPQIRDTDSM